MSDYLTRMQTAFRDLPPADFDRLLRRAEVDVAQAAAEVGIARLNSRLGSPEAYAEQLRATAGLPLSPTGPVSGLGGLSGTVGSARTALAGLVISMIGGILLGSALMTSPIGVVLALLAVTGVGVGISVPLIRVGAPAVAAVAALPEVRLLLSSLAPNEKTVTGISIGYVRSLQPAWWLVRAVVPMLTLAGFTLHGFGVVALVASLPATVASVSVGRKTRTDRRWLWLVAPVNAVIAGLILTLLLHQLG